MKWNIITDSSCDFRSANNQNEEVQISNVPFTISVGNRDFVDNDHLDTQVMLHAMEHEKSASRTSCPSPNEWLKQFEKADYGIAITISSQLSGSMNSAMAAKEMALEKNPQKKIAVLDSRSTGPELVLCVEEIERLIKDGADFDDIVSHAAYFLKKTKIMFALSSFDNLIKNGRMSKISGFIARKLGMWGIGGGSDEGKIIMEGKTRGAKKAVEMLIMNMKEKGFGGNKVAISHCDNLAFAEALKKRILEIWKNAEVIILPTRGLCSYYAERGGLIVSY